MQFEGLQPSELENVSNIEDRMNLFRGYFAHSRYNRLLIQKMLIKTIAEADLAGKLHEMEQMHDAELFDLTKSLQTTKFFSEFLAAAREEEIALEKILEAYKERMKNAKI
jgi:hypothetical protein